MARVQLVALDPQNTTKQNGSAAEIPAFLHPNRYLDNYVLPSVLVDVSMGALGDLRPVMGCIGSVDLHGRLRPMY